MKSTFFLFLFLLLMSHDLFAKSFRVMSYNVQNLFDVQHDEGKNDFEFLPKSFKGKVKGCQKIKNDYYKKSCIKSNWTAKKLDLKLHQIKKVIALADYPEVIALSEVENENVVRMLAGIVGYKGVIVSKSLDARGVDVAFIYKSEKSLGLKFVEKKEVKVKDTRSLLRLTFQEIKKKRRLHLFVNHWPSQGSPSKRRMMVSQKLEGMLTKLSKRDFVMIMGDFNTLDRDRPHPFHEGFNKSNSYIDLSKKRDRNSIPGSYFYGKEMAWNMFDRIFVSKNMKELVSDYKIISDQMLTGVYEYSYKKHPLYGSRIIGIPKRYNFRAKKKKHLGFSDHFPVIVKVNL